MCTACLVTFISDALFSCMATMHYSTFLSLDFCSVSLHFFTPLPFSALATCASYFGCSFKLLSHQTLPLLISCLFVVPPCLTVLSDICCFCMIFPSCLIGSHFLSVQAYLSLFIHLFPSLCVNVVPISHIVPLISSAILCSVSKSSHKDL